MSAPHLDLRAYAALAASLASADPPRDAILRAHGLDEAGWEALDRFHQDRLSRAMNEDHEGVPPLVAAYAEAFAAARARAAPASGLISIERFGDATPRDPALGRPHRRARSPRDRARRFPPRERALDRAHDDGSRFAPALPRSPRRVKVALGARPLC